MRLERELQEAEEIARKEAEAEAAALTEILNLDSALQVRSLTCTICHKQMYYNTYTGISANPIDIYVSVLAII